MPADRLVAVLYVAGGGQVREACDEVDAGPGSCEAPSGIPATAPAGVPATVLTPESCRPLHPFRGPLFAAVEEAARSVRGSRAVSDPTLAAGERAALGLVVPLWWLGQGSAARRLTGPVVVSDHVDLTLRGPLAGRWPPDRPRTFPSMRGVYAPDIAADVLAGAAPAACEVAAAGPDAAGRAASPAGRSSTSRGSQRHPAASSSPQDPAVYSRLAVAGVADASRLSVWEQRQARAAGLTAAADCLVAPVVIAAFFGLVVAAVGVPVGAETPSHGR